ncbi:MAG: rhodanese-like domain-containing protein [Deltaproteobacteria bacterium]|nr:rhodanese-like domain-containing protein [Deltaproteobacteria bacterium]
MERPDRGEDFRWYSDRPVAAGDFNKLNDVAIFAGQLIEMHASITKNEIKSLIDKGRAFRLVAVMDRDGFEAGHICGSINIPVARVEEDALNLIGRDELVVVYGKGAGDASSAVAADKFITLNYHYVLRYKGGLNEWRAARECLEGRPQEVKKAA